ncbi:hypothetical protein JHK87_047801 [Glycine soja]|nr:hypothetical protein JHK87_047801 [Glycine soja]
MAFILKKVRRKALLENKPKEVLNCFWSLKHFMGGFSSVVSYYGIEMSPYLCDQEEQLLQRYLGFKALDDIKRNFLQPNILGQKVMQNVLAFHQMGNYLYHAQLMGLHKWKTEERSTVPG